MIVRTWHGCVPIKYANSFLDHLELTGVKHAQSTKGNLGAFIRHESQGAFEHFFLATYWDDLNAIKEFAGENYHCAVCYPDDEQFELISDPYVFHHIVPEIKPI